MIGHVRHTHLVNDVLYQAGWFACVLGAAWHRPDTGAAASVLLIAVHFVLTREPRVELRLMAFALAVGLAVEWMQLVADTYRFPDEGLRIGPVPVWMALLWAQFATAFRYSLRGVLARPVVAGLFGAVGGPLAFLAGQRLGAVLFTPPLAVALLRLSAAWLLALLLFSAATRRGGPDAGGPRYRATG